MATAAKKTTAKRRAPVDREVLNERTIQAYERSIVAEREGKLLPIDSLLAVLRARYLP